MQRVVEKLNLKQKPVLILIGGGHTHALVLRQMIRNKIDSFKIILISESKVTPYSGLLPGQIAGIYDSREMNIDILNLTLECGAVFIESGVCGINFQSQTVTTNQGHQFHYDFLSINSGARPDPGAFLGSAEFAHALKPTLPFMKKFEEFVGRASQLKKVKLVQIGAGVAGVECVAAFHRKFLDLGRDTEITLVDSGAELLSSHHFLVRRSVLKMLGEYQITVILGDKVKEITKEEVITHSGRTIPYDFAAVATPARTEHWISQLDLQRSSGFIQIDEYLKTSHANVFAVGDVALNPAHPLARAGVFAVRQAPILYHNLLASLSGSELKKYYPQKNYLALISDAHGKAIASRGNFYFPRSRLMAYLKDRIDRKFMKKLNRDFA